MGRALRVKHRFRTFDVDLGEFTVAELRRAVEEATSVPPGRQKLVAKGKIINSDEDAASIKDGTTVMVLEQSATGTYGSRVAPSVSQSRGQAFQKALVKTKAAIKKAVTPAGVLKSKEIEERVAAGAKLGYLALNGVPVAEIPPGAFERSLSRIELVNCRGFHHGDCARLFSSPALQSLRKLKLNNCQLEDSHMVFQAIGGLKSLAHLELRHNQMTKIVGFPRLDHPMKILDMSDNPLTSCGDEPLAVEQLVISRCGLTSLDLGVLARCEVWMDGWMCGWCSEARYFPGIFVFSQPLPFTPSQSLPVSRSQSVTLSHSLVCLRWLLPPTTTSARWCRWRALHRYKCWTSGITGISRSFPKASLST